MNEEKAIVWNLNIEISLKLYDCKLLTKFDINESLNKMNCVA